MPPSVALLYCLVLILIFCGIGFSLWRAGRIRRAVAARLSQIQQENPLAALPQSENRCRVEILNGPPSGWRRCFIALTTTHLIVYDRSQAATERLRFSYDQLRWFGRPIKYSYGMNDIWLHVEQANGWQIVKLRLFQDTMRELVRGLKVAAAPELVTAYRRQRPYIHLGPVAARPATQDIHGAWTLAAPVRLYLMPRFLVILDGTAVLRKIPLEAVQQIAALRRLDQPGAQGLARFRAEEEAFAFALDQHEAFGGALAEAAKRTLEAPLERKQKGKDDDDEDV